MSINRCVPERGKLQTTTGLPILARHAFSRDGDIGIWAELLIEFTCEVEYFSKYFLDRKVLAEIAVSDEATFTSIVDKARSALPAA